MMIICYLNKKKNKIKINKEVQRIKRRISLLEANPNGKGPMNPPIPHSTLCFPSDVPDIAAITVSNIPSEINSNPIRNKSLFIESSSD